jgi:hypothetical protein
MSKPGERNQGKPGSPLPIGMGRGLCSGVADFFHADEKLKDRDYVISGITRDAAGAILGGCTVDVFMSQMPDMPRTLVGRAVSDVTTGQYIVFVNGPDTGMTFQAMAYLAGAPDVAGISVNTLVGLEA